MKIEPLMKEKLYVIVENYLLTPF